MEKMVLGAIKGTKVGRPLTRQRRPGFSRSRIGYFARCNTGERTKNDCIMLIPTRTNTCIGNHKWFPVGYGASSSAFRFLESMEVEDWGGERRRMCPTCCRREKEKNSRDIRGPAIRRRNPMGGERRTSASRCWKTTRETLFDRTLSLLDSR